MSLATVLVTLTWNSADTGPVSDLHRGLWHARFEGGQDPSRGLGNRGLPCRQRPGKDFLRRCRFRHWYHGADFLLYHPEPTRSAGGKRQIRARA